MVRIVCMAAVITLAGVAAPSQAQSTSPVYVDDSPTAAEVLTQLPRRNIQLQKAWLRF